MHESATSTFVDGDLVAMEHRSFPRAASIAHALANLQLGQAQLKARTNVVDEDDKLTDTLEALFNDDAVYDYQLARRDSFDRRALFAQTFRSLMPKKSFLPACPRAETLHTSRFGQFGLGPVSAEAVLDKVCLTATIVAGHDSGAASGTGSLRRSRRGGRRRNRYLAANGFSLNDEEDQLLSNRCGFGLQ